MNVIGNNKVAAAVLLQLFPRKVSFMCASHMESFPGKDYLQDFLKNSGVFKNTVDPFLI